MTGDFGPDRLRQLFGDPNEDGVYLVGVVEFSDDASEDQWSYVGNTQMGTLESVVSRLGYERRDIRIAEPYREPGRGCCRTAQSWRSRRPPCEGAHPGIGSAGSQRRRNASGGQGIQCHRHFRPSLCRSVPTWRRRGLGSRSTRERSSTRRPASPSPTGPTATPWSSSRAGATCSGTRSGPHWRHGRSGGRRRFHDAPNVLGATSTGSCPTSGSGEGTGDNLVPEAL